MFIPEITQSDIARFNRDGFIIFDQFLDRAQIDLVLERIEPIFSGHFETGILPDKVKWLQGRDRDGIPRSMCNVWKSDRAIASVVLNQAIGKITSLLMGWDGARCNQDSLIWIPPKAGTICFHQDNSYQDWHEPGEVVTCWMALSETTEEGGTLEYARGSHKWPLSERVGQFAGPENYRSELERAARRAEASIEIVPVVVPAGGVAFHHGTVWHGSDYNRTAKPRYSIATHCMRADSCFSRTLTSPMFSRYRRFQDLVMDESFFPILWTNDGQRSKFLDEYSFPREEPSTQR